MAKIEGEGQEAISVNFMERLLAGVELEWKALWQVTTWDKRFNAVDNYKQPRVINFQYLLAADLFKLEKELRVLPRFAVELSQT